MKTSKAKQVLLSFLGILIMGVLMTSCEQEELFTEDNLSQQSKQTYIVKFKTDEKKKNDIIEAVKRERELQDRTKVEFRTTVKNDFEREMDEIIKNLKLSPENVKNYFFLRHGVSMALTNQEVEELKKNPQVESIEADEIHYMELPTIQEIDDNELKSYGEVKCSNDKHGGYEPGGGDKDTWIWIPDTGIDLDHNDLNVIDYPLFAKSFVDDLPPNDTHGHGTHVAGIAAAKKNNLGIVGMSAGAPVVPIKITNQSRSSLMPYYTNTTLVAALEHIWLWCIPNDVVNLSICKRGQVSNDIKYYLQQLSEEEVYVVIAAGNNYAPANKYEPAHFNNSRTYTIGSMTCSDNPIMLGSSNYGLDVVDYLSVGEEVVSTYLNNGYKKMTGTSMSAAIVSGIIHANEGSPSTYSKKVEGRGKEYYYVPRLKY